MAAPSQTLPPPLPLRPVPARTSLQQLVDQEHRRARRRWIIWLSGAVVALALAAALALLLRPKPVPMVARFRTQPVSTGPVVHEVNATGRLEAVSAVSVGAEISGRIDFVDVDFNSRVTQGQVLARFDRRTLDAQLAQTRATLAAAKAAVAQASFDREQAQRNLSRANAIFDKGGISASDHETAVTAASLSEARVQAAKAQLAAQEAALSVAKNNLDHAEVRAPVDGMVISRNVDPGQTVASLLQSPTLFLVATDLVHMRAIASVDEADIGDVQQGQRATFTVNAYPDRIYQGVVTEVRNAPVIVQDVVTYGVVVTVENEDLSLRPGMTAAVHVRTAEQKDGARVANGALRFTPPGSKRERGQQVVFVLEAGQPKAVAVKTGVSDGELTAVEGAPAEGTALLVDLTPEGRRFYGSAAK